MSVQLDDARGYIWLTLIGRAQVLGLAPREQQCASPAYEALHLRHVALCHSAARAAHAWGAPVELLGGPGGSAPLSRVPPGAVLSVVRGAMELYPSRLAIVTYHMGGKVEIRTLETACLDVPNVPVFNLNC
eukprot:5624355-Pyramimonas_sp.AAC.1